MFVFLRSFYLRHILSLKQLFLPFLFFPGKGFGGLQSKQIIKLVDVLRLRKKRAGKSFLFLDRHSFFRLYNRNKCICPLIIDEQKKEKQEEKVCDDETNN